jgi:transposase
VRVSTAFNTMLAIPGATVASVTFAPEGVVVGLRRRFRRLTCPCGHRSRAAYDSSIRRWRHLDLGACRLLLEAEIRRLSCRRCGRVRTEQVPWARDGARHTKDLEDVVAFLVQRVDKTTVARLLRVSWEAVANIVTRVVAGQIDDARLDELYRIGVDEISYRKGHRYLTVVADHDKEGAVVWAAEGKKAETLKAFYDELGDDRKARLQAVSLDMGSAYERATLRRSPTSGSASIRSTSWGRPTRRSNGPAGGRGTWSERRTRRSGANGAGRRRDRPRRRAVPGGSSTRGGRCSRIPIT